MILLAMVVIGCGSGKNTSSRAKKKERPHVVTRVLETGSHIMHPMREDASTQIGSSPCLPLDERRLCAVRSV
jgi:hypothetical protein